MVLPCSRPKVFGEGLEEGKIMPRKSMLIAMGFVAALFIGSAQAADYIRLAPGPDAQERVQAALIEIDPGGVIELESGLFEFTDGLSLDIPGVVLVGQGKYQTVLSFKGQVAGSEGLMITSDDVTLQDFGLEDAKGDGIKAKDVVGINMFNLRVEWTNGPATTNGAYGLYPVGSKKVLIDGCLVIGASDAGIYVGQSEQIIIRNSLARDNVAGFEIENSYYADVFNNVAVNNTGGFLIFDLPDLPQQGGHHVRLFENIAINNNTANFAPEGNIVASVPQGLGVMIMANRDVEVFNNVIAGNQTVGISINSYVEEATDENYEPHPRAINIHDNTFGKNGWQPMGVMGQQASQIAGGALPDIVWDGLLPIAYGGKIVPAEDWIYVMNNKGIDGAAGFINLNFEAMVVARMMGNADFIPTPSRDLQAHTGSLPALPPVILYLPEE
jgi:parallel beta-helix repeat protein